MSPEGVDLFFSKNLRKDAKNVFLSTNGIETGLVPVLLKTQICRQYGERRSS